MYSVFGFKYSSNNIDSKNDNNIKVTTHNLHTYINGEQFTLSIAILFKYYFCFLLKNNIFYCSQLYKYK